MGEENIIEGIQKLKDEISKVTPESIEDVSTKKTLEKFYKRLADSERRLMRMYQDYIKNKVSFSQEVESSDFSQEPISYSGSALQTSADYFAQEVLLLIDIMAESFIEIFQGFKEDEGIKAMEEEPELEWDDKEEDDKEEEKEDVPENVFDKLLGDKDEE